MSIYRWGKQDNSIIPRHNNTMPFQTVNQQILKERTLYLCWSIRATCFHNVADKDTRLMTSINKKFLTHYFKGWRYSNECTSAVSLSGSIYYRIETNKKIMQTYAVR